MAQHRRCVARLALGQGEADGGGRDFAAADADQLSNRHPDAAVTGKRHQIARSPRPALAKAEIAADDDVGHAEAVIQHHADEFRRGQGRQRRVERQFIQPRHAEFRQPVRARFRVHQPEGRGVWRKVLAGVGFKGDDAKRTLRAGQVDDRAVAQMHPVEIAHRHRRATRLGGKPLPMLKYLHSAPVVPSRTCGLVPEPAPRPSAQGYRRPSRGFQG